MKLDVLSNLEGVLGPTILTGWDITLAQVTLEVSRVGWVVRIHSNQ